MEFRSRRCNDGCCAWCRGWCNTGAGLLYSSGAFTATSGGALTLRGDVIGRTNNASSALSVSSTSLNLNAGASGNGAVNVTSGAAIQLDSLDTTGSGAVAITTTAGNIQVGNGTGTAINNAGTGALTITSAGNIDVTEALTQAGAITLESATTGNIFGDSVVKATGAALTLRANEIDDDGDASDDSSALQVVSGSLVIDVDGNSSSDGVKITSADAISLTALTSAGSRSIDITTTNSTDANDDISIGGTIDSNGTGTLTLTANDDVDVNNALTHDGAIVITAHGAGNTSGTAKAGNLYGDSVVTATGSALTLAGDLIGDDASATSALGVSSSSLNIDASNSGNGLVKVTSGAAIQLDSLDTTGSGAVAITTTSGNIQIGNGTGTAINNAGTGALTVTSAGNVDVTEALTQAGAITLTANGGGTKAGSVFGDSVVTATGSALTLEGDLIGSDSTATSALGVSSSSLNVDAGAAGNGVVKITSGAAIQLDALDTTGSGAVAITTTSGNIQVGNGTGTAINNAGTGALTITSAGNIDVTEALTQAGAITLESAATGKVFGDSIVTATSSALTLRADEIDNDGDASNAGALGVASGSLIIDVDGNTSAEGVKITSADAINLAGLTSAGGRAIEITTTNSSDANDDITIGGAIDSDGTGSLTITANDDVDIANALTHDGAISVVAHGAGNTTNTGGAGNLYGAAVVTATGSALTLRGDQIGSDASATNALGVSSSSLNVNAGASGNGLVKLTSGAAIQLDSLDTTGSGAVASRRRLEIFRWVTVRVLRLTTQERAR